MPGKKQNSKKNYLAHQSWMENKKKDRPLQRWVGFWIKLPNP